MLLERFVERQQLWAGGYKICNAGAVGRSQTQQSRREMHLLPTISKPVARPADKFLRSIEFVADYRTVGEGLGGVRKDHQQYDLGVEI
jgi:hypothetical protein